MEWLTNAINGQNGLGVLGLLILILAVVGIMVKKGLLSFNGKGLQVGYRNAEQAVIRKQMQYMTMAIDATIRDLPDNLTKDTSYYRTKYVISKVKDIFVDAIIYNHIEDSDDYVELKQEMVYSQILKITEDDFFRTDEFKKYIYVLIKKIIQRLVKIRKASY